MGFLNTIQDFYHEDLKSKVEIEPVAFSVGQAGFALSSAKSAALPSALYISDLSESVIRSIDGILSISSPWAWKKNWLSNFKSIVWPVFWTAEFVKNAALWIVGSADVSRQYFQDALVHFQNWTINKIPTSIWNKVWRKISEFMNFGVSIPCAIPAILGKLVNKIDEWVMPLQEKILRDNDEAFTPEARGKFIKEVSSPTIF
jgi:hypothetical protein